MDIEALKQTPHPAFRNDSRMSIREEIRAALDAMKAEGSERRFLANYWMSKYGYGGGF
jgi:hypothetical protein